MDVEKIEKALKERNKAEITLGEDEKAIYIGSGPYIENISHITPLVNAKTYILSDIKFEKNEEVIIDDVRIIISKKDGFELVKKDKNIKFVMIDQAVSYKDKLRLISENAYVCFWTMSKFNDFEKIIYERMGLKYHSTHQGVAIFVKKKEPSKNDVKVAEYLKDIYSIITVKLLLNVKVRIPPDYERFKKMLKELEKPEFKLIGKEKQVIKEFIKKMKERRIEDYIIEEIKDALNWKD